jgi:hypothetical protein
VGTGFWVFVVIVAALTIWQVVWEIARSSEKRAALKYQAEQDKKEPGES